MEKKQDDNIIDYNEIYNKIYYKVMKQLNGEENNQNLNALIEPELKKEVQKINQKCTYCLFNDINITLTENDLNKYFLMKITGKTKVAKLYEVYISKNQFALVTSDGIVCITDEKGICNEMTDVCVVRKLEHFPNIDLTENTNFGDIFITKNGHKLKYIYKLSPSNNQEFIYIFTDDNKVYSFNRYGESYTNENNLYVKYVENNNNTNKLLDITPDIIKQSNENFNDLMKQFNENVQPLDNKQNINLTNNDDYNKKYNHTQYKKTQETDGVKQTLAIGTLYMNKEDYSIICIKDIQESLMFQCSVDVYSLDEDYHYKLYKDEYMLFDSTTLSKEDTTINIEGYIQITEEQFNNIIKNNEITKNNVKIIKRDFINLLNNTILYNKLYPNK